MGITEIMTHVIKYVGKPTPFAGKTLWEIVGNLKDFGVGRIVVRNSTKEFKEPSFLKILEVKARPNEIPRKIKVFRWPNDFRDKDVSACDRFIIQYLLLTCGIFLFIAESSVGSCAL